MDTWSLDNLQCRTSWVQSCLNKSLWGLIGRWTGYQAKCTCMIFEKGNRLELVSTLLKFPWKHLWSLLFCELALFNVTIQAIKYQNVIKGRSDVNKNSHKPRRSLPHAEISLKSTWKSLLINTNQKHEAWCDFGLLRNADQVRIP